MGCFGYICKGCNTPIRGNCFTGGEKCVMIHVRNGDEIGRVEGHYDEYGRVIEQDGLPDDEVYRGEGSGINRHSEICKSEFDLEDSYFRLQGMRVYKDREMFFYDFAASKRDETPDFLQKKFLNALTAEQRKAISSLVNTDRTAAEKLARCFMFEIWLDSKQIMKEFRALPIPKRDSYSGTVAWHHLCYNRAAEHEKADLTPSESDPNQSWGIVRKKYS